MSLRVQPKSSRNAIRVDADGEVRVHVTAAPADGAANEAVRRVLAEALGLPKSAVQIVHGLRGRDKQVSIAGVSIESVVERLRNCSRS